MKAIVLAGMEDSFVARYPGAFISGSYNVYNACH